MKNTSLRAMAAAIAAVAASSLAADQAPAAAPLEDTDFGRWYISPGVGFWNLEGDEGLEDSFYVTVRVGYDWSEWWSFEMSAVFAPSRTEEICALAVERAPEALRLVSGGMRTAGSCLAGAFRSAGEGRQRHEPHN